MTNAAIARILVEMADICEIRGDNAFKIRALRNAAQAIETLPHDLSAMARSEDAAKRLREIPGIGAGIAQKIVEICETGDCREHRDLLVEFPPTLLELLSIDGVGPKKARLFHDALGVKTLDDLERAAREGKIRDLPKMGARTEEKILKSIAEHKARAGRWLLSQAEEVVERLLALARSVPGVRRVEAAGSFRRRRETVGDIDLLATCDDPTALMARFAAAGAVIGTGGTKTSIRLSSGLQCDLRIVPEESFGAALYYFTGSKAHNIAARTMAVRRGLTVNEYGVFRALPDGSPGERIAGRTEEEVFAAIGLPWIPPELRENRGEIEAALEGRLPRLIAPGDLRGDLHMHTTETDGTASIEDMARAALACGHGYCAITEHSKALAFTNGLDESRLAAHAARIREVDRRMGGRIRVLAGIEVDILADGALDLAHDALHALDIVIASVHSRFDMPREEMTERIVRAIESGAADAIGHPTGRILLRREPYPLDMERVMRAARARGVALEVSAYPDRLDLNDVHCRLAKEMGVKLLIDTDAHAPSHLALQRFGVDTARRAWLEKEDVLNTRECDDFLAALHAGHRPPSPLRA
jgi:DNA polymerase (family 10)